MTTVISASRTAFNDTHSAMTHAAAALEHLITQRQRDVAAAMAHYEATGVSEHYQAHEQQWTARANDVLATIHALKDAVMSAHDTTQLTCSRLSTLASRG